MAVYNAWGDGRYVHVGITRRLITRNKHALYWWVYPSSGKDLDRSSRRMSRQDRLFRADQPTISPLGSSGKLLPFGINTTQTHRRRRQAASRSKTPKLPWRPIVLGFRSLPALLSVAAPSRPAGRFRFLFLLKNASSRNPVPKRETEHAWEQQACHSWEASQAQSKEESTVATTRVRRVTRHKLDS